MTDTTTEVVDARVGVYGDPTETFTQIAQMWAGYLGTKVEATDVPLMLAQMKMVRAKQAPDYSDNSDDIEGYLDIFRKIVGEDMVKARSVSEYLELKEQRVHPPVLMSEKLDEATSSVAQEFGHLKADGVTEAMIRWDLRSVAELGISTAIALRLQESNVHSVHQLRRLTPSQLLMLRGIGPHAVGKIASRLRAHGLELAS